jgi:hypothetical protein
MPREDLERPGVDVLIAHRGCADQAPARRRAESRQEDREQRRACRGGDTFHELPHQPLPGRQVTSGSTYYGYMGFRSEFAPPDEDGNRFLFITYSDTGNNLMGMEGFGVDGALFRYQIDASGNIVDWENITPVRITDSYVRAATPLTHHQFGHALGGVSVDPQVPGAIIVSTLRQANQSPDPAEYARPMDTIYRSLDYGETWFPINNGYNRFGNLAFEEKAPYARPLVNGVINNKAPGGPAWEPKRALDPSEIPVGLRRHGHRGGVEGTIEPYRVDLDQPAQEGEERERGAEQRSHLQRVMGP